MDMIENVEYESCEVINTTKSAWPNYSILLKLPKNSACKHQKGANMDSRS